jgi:hypothetical protein
MLLFREVYGWLRFLTSKDPLCNEHGVVVEEMYSTYAPFSDANDGVRTLVLRRVQDGMTPRIEYRAIGLHPQIYWYPAGASEGVLEGTTNNFGFPGDFKSLDCSDACQYLLALAKDKLCSEGGEGEGAEATVKVTSAKIIEYPVVKRILDAVERASHKGTRLTGDMVNKWLKDNEGADLMDFALSVMHWFDAGKISWKEIDYLEDEYAPGKDIIEWSWLKRQLNAPERMGKLPPPIADRVAAPASLMPAQSVQARFDETLRRFTQGKPVRACATADAARFGLSAIAHLKAGSIPFRYLQQLELCDPHEAVLPWSFVRRNVLSYAQGRADEDSSSLPLLILDWLKQSHLLLLLYKGDPKQEEALSKAIEAQLEHHSAQTLENDAWMKPLLNSLSSDSVAEMKRSLQVEFDLWLFDALSPAVQQWRLPLSPHSFSVGQKDQDSYGKMYRAWEKKVKDYLKAYRDGSGKRLAEAVSQFYSQVVALWKTEELKDYKAKVPSASRILDAVGAGSMEGLLDVLCEDLEHEAGGAMPDEMKIRLVACPWFNAIWREVKIQAMP